MREDCDLPSNACPSRESDQQSRCDQARDLRLPRLGHAALC
jgi:hypothetical protein